VKVVITTEALEDLERIGAYIAQDNPPRARSFVQELMEKARQLGDIPQGFPLVPRYAHLGIRRRAHGSYLTSIASRKTGSP
jgi:toxin ParE1/3/4